MFVLLPYKRHRGLDYKQVDYDLRMEYSPYKKIIVKPEIVTAMIDFKIWGKGMYLNCFFREPFGQKRKIMCPLSRFDDESGYGPRDKSIDFSEPYIEGNLSIFAVKLPHSWGRYKALFLTKL